MLADVVSPTAVLLDEGVIEGLTEEAGNDVSRPVQSETESETERDRETETERVRERESERKRETKRDDHNKEQDRRTQAKKYVCIKNIPITHPFIHLPTHSPTYSLTAHSLTAHSLSAHLTPALTAHASSLLSLHCAPVRQRGERHQLWLLVSGVAVQRVRTIRLSCLALSRQICMYHIPHTAMHRVSAIVQCDMYMNSQSESQTYLYKHLECMDTPVWISGEELGSLFMNVIGIEDRRRARE